MERNENDSLWKSCKTALQKTIEEDSVLGGIDMDKALENLFDLINVEEFSKEDLIQKLSTYYFSSIASDIEWASLQRGQKVYFNRNTGNKIISGKLVLNARQLAEILGLKADDLEKNYCVKFTSDPNVINGQSAMDLDNPGSYLEERPFSELVKLVKENS